MYIHIHMLVYTHIHTDTHAQMHAHTHACAHACIRAHTPETDVGVKTVFGRAESSFLSVIASTTVTLTVHPLEQDAENKGSQRSPKHETF